MQDIDDFDPLDDILLSDEEFPDDKHNKRTVPSIFQKPKEITVIDEQSKEDKKKRMLAELFGTNNDPKEEPNNIEEPAAPVNKSDWLDLKTDVKPNAPENVFNKAVTWQTPTETPITSSMDTMKFDIFNEKQTNIESKDRPDTTPVLMSDINSFSDRRKSESSSQSNTKKSKQRFKSLDLDLEFDFDRSTDIEANKTKNISHNTEPTETGNTSGRSEFKSVKTVEETTKNKNTLDTTQPVDTESAYVPSSGINRRFGTPKGRSHTDKNKISSHVIPDTSLKVVSTETVKDTLPTWLEPKNTDDRLFPVTPIIERTDKRQHEKGITIEKPTKNIIQSNENEIQPKSKSNINIMDDSQKDVVPTVLELKRKQEELKNIAKTQTDNLIQHEQAIQNSAIKLMQQHRHNINALMQIISSDKMTDEVNEKSSNRDEILSKIENLENTISQFQIKLLQQELEKSEFQLKLEHSEKKNSADIAMLEDLHRYKLQIAEEREIYLKKEMQALEEEYILKIQRQKENEEELIRTYKEKIKSMQEEHLNEVKYIADYHSAKSLKKESRIDTLNESISNERITSKELAAKEIALEAQQKKLLDFEEQLNCQKVTLEGKIAGLEAKTEEFESKCVKEKLTIEQQRKDIKLSQTIFQEKEISWEKEKQREKEYLRNYKEELEKLKENLIKDEKKLMKEKFQLSTEKARLEAVINLDATPGQMGDMLQNKAELQGTMEEINRLKSKLESEREGIKVEERRLKEESWKLKDIEQQLMMQNKYFQKLLNESETKREEGIQALKKAQRIESQMNDRMEEIEKRLLDLRRKEEQMTKEKIEISKERDLLNKRRYQLDMFLPQLTYEEQLPFNIMNKNIIDPRIMIMKLKAENDMDSLFGH